MKKGILFCVLSFLINLTINSKAGEPEMKYSPISAVSGEKIGLFTDRNIYIVNEKIYFTAEYSCIEEFDSLSWSNVLYVELIRWNGDKLVQMKLKLTRPGTRGIMEIPGNIISGNFYLRAYTKWMRNFSVYEYTYVPVKIVNPFHSETDEGPMDKKVSSAVVMLRNKEKNLIDGVSCTMDKNEYKPREKAEVGIKINDSKLTDPDRYCVSVVKAGAIDTAFLYYKPEPSSPESNHSYIEYLPEIRGATISGQIIDRSTKLPLKDVLVSLSETRNGEHFAVYQTNIRGRFVFSLPDMQGQHDFFIQAESPSEILIDHDFCNQPVKLPYVAFNLNKAESDLIKEMVINQQLSDRYMTNIDVLSESKHSKTEPIVFYGSKSTVYYTDKYIELPDVEEFINEIIMEATVIYKKDKAPFISMRRDDFEYYLPLILMDNIQVNNDALLLKTSLSRIKRVEVINMDYIIGEMKYNGILSFYSRNKDLAGLDLNKNSMFFTYELYSDTYPGNDFSIRSSDSRIPDRRNLLYWNPDIQLSPDKETTISFFTPDCTGDYVVYIRTKNSNDNDCICGKCYFSVK
jgi:hypothetical protein